MGITESELDEMIAPGGQTWDEAAEMPNLADFEKDDELVAFALTCKVDGCERPYLSQKGRYGRLCEVHVAEAKAENAALAEALVDGPPVVVPPFDESDESEKSDTIESGVLSEIIELAYHDVDLAIEKAERSFGEWLREMVRDQL